jgi:hypothetical protein
VEDVMALVREHHKNGVKETDEGKRREERDKALVEKFFTREIPHGIPCDYAGQQWNAKILSQQDVRYVTDGGDR